MDLGFLCLSGRMLNLLVDNPQFCLILQALSENFLREPLKCDPQVPPGNKMSPSKVDCLTWKIPYS